MLFSGYDHDEDKGIKFPDWKLCAHLAIAWNCIDVARRNIFNDANHKYWHVSGEVIGKEFYFNLVANYCACDACRNMSIAVKC